jgi:hypothetical protein
MTTTTAPAEQAASSLNVPPGVRGAHREMFLSLADDQKRVYRRHWFECGRPAAICYKCATGEYNW